MREYVHLHRKALASWVFEDPRRWHFFSFLLMKADERGRVEVSVNECAMKLKIPRTTIGRILDDMVKWNVIGMKTEQRYTVITICKYELYNTTSAEGWNDNGTITEQFAPSQEEKEEERERKFPPHPLIKKEKSEKREELSATPLRRKGENDGQGLLFQELKEEYDGTAVNTEDSTPKAPSAEGPESSPSGEPEGGPVPTFEQFWDAYAYKRDRRAAERAWKRLSAADRRAAYEGIAAYRDDCAACERQMMYAQGYLNRRRWEDDYSTSPHPQGTPQQTPFTQQPPFTQPQTPRHYEIRTYQTTDRGRYSREEQRTAERNLRAQQAADLIARLAAQNRPVDQDLR